MARRLACLLLAAASCLWLLACASPPPPKPLEPVPKHPNIVLVIGDDVAYTDFGFMGSPVAVTPNLDRLAAEGTVFPLGFATASVDQPALRTLLTGLDPLMYETRERIMRRRLDKLGKAPPPVAIAAMPTLPRMLGKQGYVSFMAGKYWEGASELAGFTDGTVPILGAERLVRVTMDPVYEFIDAHAAEPFFLWFAPQLPHMPYDAPPRFAQLYAGAHLSPAAEGYFANLSRLDAAVGELVAHLEEKGLRERTLVVYVSDNGWQVEGFNEAGDMRDGPKGKQSLYELGLRTPIVFNAPGWVPAGVVRKDLVSTTDIVPTLLAYAGVPERGGLLGYDLRPVIEGTRKGQRGKVIGSMDEVRRANPRARLLGKGPRSGAYLRSEQWYFIQYDGGQSELFDVREDPGQEHDVSAEHPDVVAELRLKVSKWRAKMTVGRGPRLIFQRQRTSKAK